MVATFSDIFSKSFAAYYVSRYYKAFTKIEYFRLAHGDRAVSTTFLAMNIH